MFNGFNEKENLINQIKVNNLDIYNNSDSEVKLLIKKYLFMIIKDNFFLDINMKKNYYKSKSKCYSYDFKKVNFISKELINECIKKCDNKYKNYNKYMNDIEFFLNQKINQDISKCTKDKILKNKENSEIFTNTKYNNCLWNGYNKMEKRLKGYWKEKKEKLIESE